MSEKVHALTKEHLRTRVYSCSGASTSARLAQDIAARLRKLRAGPVADRTIVVDGCPSACASRGLEARGIDAQPVGLEELGVRPGDDLDERARTALLARIVERLRVQGHPPQLRRRRRPARPPVRERDGKRVHTQDDYLYAIFTLTSPVAVCGAVGVEVPTIAAHVARVLSVSRPSAGAMLARLEAAGQIERGPGGEVLLTEAGRARAEHAVRRHRLTERFVTDFLDYTAPESHDLALQIREALDERMMARIASMVAPPARCPHGWSLDPAAERDQPSDLVALPALPLGSRAVVGALAEEDARLLERIYELGLEPGAEVALIERLAGRLTVAVDGCPRSLDEGDAGAVFVRAKPGATRSLR